MTSRVKSARLNGSLGGKQGSRLLSDEQREERARKAGNALLELHGREYYSFLRSRSTKKPTRRRIIKEHKAILSSAGKRLGVLANMRAVL